MKRNFLYVLFLVVVMAVCAAPSVGMMIFGESEAAANEILASKPSLTNPDGSFNTSLNDDITSYIADRMAFRQEIITAYAAVKAAVFHESASEDVLIGTEHWLFYAPTLDDFLHRNVMTQRQIDGIVRTLEMMSNYASERGAEFVFTIAPNKNSLYGMFMSESRTPEDVKNNSELLRASLTDSDVNYADMYDAFKNQDEILYYRLDSHWDKRGAAFACDVLMNSLQYSDRKSEGYYSKVTESSDGHLGDLYSMLYPAGNFKEDDCELSGGYSFTYDGMENSLAETATDLSIVPVDSIRIDTSCEKASGSLLMFRDSFGNNLYPYLAQSFGHAVFSRLMPYRMDWIEETEADTVVVEIVERNLKNLSLNAPVMQAPELSSEQSSTIMNAAGISVSDTDEGSFTAGNNRTRIENVQLITEKSEDLQGFTKVSGIYDGEAIESDVRVYLYTADGHIYEACPVGNSSGFSEAGFEAEDAGTFTAYIPGNISDGEITDIILESNGNYYVH